MEFVSLNTPVIIFNRQLLQKQKPESPTKQSTLFSPPPSSSSSKPSRRLCSISHSKTHPRSSSPRTHFAPMALSKNHKGNAIFVPNEHDALQRHVAFFDRNHDGVIYPWETFQGFRAIGCGIALSLFGAIFINIGLSGKTRSGKYPSLLFPIEVRNIHKAKHGSDSGVYDNEGRFVPAKFEELFAKHAHTHHNALTSDEVMGMLKANREPKDFKGWVAAYSEWKILYILCKDKNGLLLKDTVRGVYDGGLFEKMEKERLASLKKD